MIAEKPPSRKSWYNVFCVLLLLVITIMVFNYTVEIREPYFGKLSEGGHQWLTGSTLEFSTEWYTENPENLNFAMMEEPASIEFPTLISRRPYTSYPPGTIIPIYVLSKIRQKEPTLSMIMEYNLVNHFWIAFILSLIVFFFLRRQMNFDFINSTLYATIPIFIQLLMPGTIYWHQNVFFSDQAIILPFVVFTLLEVFRYNSKKNLITVLDILQSIVMFYGVLTDWFFIPIITIVYLKRLINQEIKPKDGVNKFLLKTFYFWIPALLACLLFIWQVYSLQNFGQTISRMMVRTSLSASNEISLQDFVVAFGDHFTTSYGHFAEIILINSLLLMAIFTFYILISNLKKRETNHKIKNTLLLAWMLILPCLIHSILFRNHTFIHSFSVLKYSVPLCIIPFVIIPILFYLLLEEFNFPKKYFTYGNHKLNLNILTIFIVAVILAGSTIASESSQLLSMFPPPNNDYTVLGNSIQKNTNYYDVVFSPDLEIKSLPPQQISLSMKRVYKINSLEDIKNRTKGINGNYSIMMVFSGPPTTKWKLLLQNSSYNVFDGYYFYRISPDHLNYLAL